MQTVEEAECQTLPHARARGRIWRHGTRDQLLGATTRIRAIMPPSSCSRMWQWNTKSPISWNGISTITVVGRQAPLMKASAVPSQLSVTAARGSGTLSCSTRPSGVWVGRTVPGTVPPCSSRKRVWWMWKLWSSSVRLISSQTSLTASPWVPSGTQTVVAVGSNTLMALRVAAISRPLSSIST